MYLITPAGEAYPIKARNKGPFIRIYSGAEGHTVVYVHPKDGKMLILSPQYTTKGEADTFMKKFLQVWHNYDVYAVWCQEDGKILGLGHVED